MQFWLMNFVKISLKWELNDNNKWNTGRDKESECKLKFFRFPGVSLQYMIL